jgi:hypothetical protein
VTRRITHCLKEGTHIHGVIDWCHANSIPFIFSTKPPYDMTPQIYTGKLAKRFFKPDTTIRDITLTFVEGIIVREQDYALVRLRW